jgi:hypothetical protein
MQILLFATALDGWNIEGLKIAAPFLCQLLPIAFRQFQIRPHKTFLNNRISALRSSCLVLRKSEATRMLKSSLESMNGRKRSMIAIGFLRRWFCDCFHVFLAVTCKFRRGYFPTAGLEDFAAGFEGLSPGLVDGFASGFFICAGAAGSDNIFMSSTSKMRVAFGSIGPAPFSP